MQYILIYFLLFFTSSLSLANDSGSITKKPISIVANSLEVSQDESTATCIGDVVVTQDNITIKADKMIIYYIAGQKESIHNAISKIEIEGHVKFTTNNKTASSNKGKFDLNKNILQLDGNVNLTQGGNIIEGDRLIYNLGTGIAQIFSDHSKIKAVIVQEQKPQKNLDKSPDAKPREK